MKRKSATGWIAGILTACLLVTSNIFADIIYLDDGNVLIVEKAWEEGAEVKYRVGKEIRSLPKSSVETIRQELQTPPPADAKTWNVG